VTPTNNLKIPPGILVFQLNPHAVVKDSVASFAAPPSHEPSTVMALVHCSITMKLAQDFSQIVRESIG
jgi:hypothetical protein